ncbi:MAG: hypothetical protein ACI8P3_001057 [Saprospiraceae bacterium]|jgi:hypothetical protein
MIDLEAEWLQWMKETHIPDVMNTGLFVDQKTCKLLHEEEDGGVTYALQYFCKDMDTFLEYQKNHSKALQADHASRYKDKYVAFRTLMEIIE